MNRSRPIGELSPPPRREPALPHASAPSLRIITSQSLFLGACEIGIEHRGALYRLKITRQGKLILNK